MTHQVYMTQLTGFYEPDRHVSTSQTTGFYDSDDKFLRLE
jgi:hypothetical protein